MLLIRNARKDDLPAVLDMVRELAEYEKAPLEVTATLADYERAFDDELIHCIVAEQHGSVVGIALMFMAFSTWKGRMLFLEDFVVKLNLRGTGIGRWLFKEVLLYAKQEKVALVKWQVLDWNEPAIKFYKKNQAEVDTEWYNCKLFAHQYDEVIAGL